MKTNYLILVILLITLSVNVHPNLPNRSEDEKNASVKTTAAQIVCTSEAGSFRGQVTVTLDHSFGDMPAALLNANRNPDSYKIIRLSEGAKTDLSGTGAENSPIGNSITFDIPNTFNFTKKDTVGLGLLANNTSLVDGSSKVASSLITITVSDTCTPPAENLPGQTEPETKKEFKPLSYVKAYGVDKTKLSWKFAIDGNKGTRRYFTNDVDIRPFRITGYRFGGGYEVIPGYVKFRFSGNEESPVNTLELGVTINHLRVFHDDGKRIPREKDYNSGAFGITSSLSSRIETDWFFNKEVNWITGYRTGLQMNLLHNDAFALRITPFIGLESGYRIKSKSATTKEPWIVRPLFGSTLYFAPFRTEKKTPLTLEIEYTKRFLLKPEPQYAPINGKATFIGLSRRTRDYVHAKFTFFADGVVSPFIEYRYGREPPKYVLENNRFTAGIQVSFDNGDEN